MTSTLMRDALRSAMRMPCDPHMHGTYVRTNGTNERGGYPLETSLPCVTRVTRKGAPFTFDQERESYRKRSKQPSRQQAERARGRTREQAKNAQDRPHSKPEWKRVRLVILADHPPCGICGDPIDYALKFPDPMSPSVDHIVSWRKGGAWFDLDNLRAAHFGCNSGRREDVA